MVVQGLAYCRDLVVESCPMKMALQEFEMFPNKVWLCLQMIQLWDSALDFAVILKACLDQAHFGLYWFHHSLDTC